MRSNNTGRIMSRKSKQPKHKKNFSVSLSQVDKWLDLIGHQIFQGNYAEAVTLCERLLNYLPQHAPQRIDVLDRLGTAQAAKLLGVSAKTVSRYCEAGLLEADGPARR